MQRSSAASDTDANSDLVRFIDGIGRGVKTNEPMSSRYWFLIVRTFVRASMIGFVASCARDADDDDSRAKATRASTPVVEVQIQEGFPDKVIEVLNNLGKRATGDTNLSDSAEIRLRSVFVKHSRWEPGETITVSFLGGSPTVRARIANAVAEWSSSANIHFDFWTDSTKLKFREWSRDDTDYQSDVRIAFDTTGYWALLGTEAIKLSSPDVESMNLEGFDRRLPSNWKAVTLHEFGHVLSLEHEHQNPNANCDQEFRWEDDLGYVPTQNSDGSFVPDSRGKRPGIYTVLGGPPNGWKRERVDFNLKRFAPSSDRIVSKFDPLSIMMYHFDEWMFQKGRSSPCYTVENSSISAEDRRIVSDKYGPAGAITNRNPIPDKLTQTDIVELHLSPAAAKQVQATLREYNAGKMKIK